MNGHSELRDKLWGPDLRDDTQELERRLEAVLGDYSRLAPGRIVEAASQAVLRQLSRHPGPRLQNVTAAALMRGVARREELKNEEGGHISADQARHFLGISKPAVLDRYAKGKLLGWRDEKQNAVRFPVWQFGQGGGLLPGLAEVLQVFSQKSGFDDWAKMLFFLNRRRSVGDKRPLDLLREGKIGSVLELAEGDE